MHAKRAARWADVNRQYALRRSDIATELAEVRSYWRAHMSGPHHSPPLDTLWSHFKDWQTQCVAGADVPGAYYGSLIATRCDTGTFLRLFHAVSRWCAVRGLYGSLQGDALTVAAALHLCKRWGLRVRTRTGKSAPLYVTARKSHELALHVRPWLGEVLEHSQRWLAENPLPVPDDVEIPGRVAGSRTPTANRVALSMR